MWGLAPLLRHVGDDMGFAMLVMWACGALYLACLASDPEGIRNTWPLSFLSPSSASLLRFGASGALPVLGYGHWWTLLSAGWLHGSVLHILFNMMWVRQLAPATAELFGPGRMVIIYTAGSIAGFALSSFAGAYLPDLIILRGGQFTVGASAPIFGLLGALVYYGRRTGSSSVGSQATSWAMSMMLFGFLMPGIDNYAHAGGFGGGWLAARVLDPLAPERIDHIGIAVACLALSLASVAASVFFGLDYLG
jgi:rhomboid protease GluP